MKPVTVVVVGLGNFGRLHAETLAHLTEANLVGLVDRDPRTLEIAKQKFPGVPVWTELEPALAACDAEGWIVAASTAAHVPLARQILSAGRTVLVEKPLAKSLSDADSLAPLIAPNACNFMAGHIVLFNSEFRKLVEEVRCRPPLAFIECVRHRPATTMQLFPGESPFHLTMVHDLYCVASLMHGAEPVRISAQAHRTASGECDLALAQLMWSDGAIASFAASFMTPGGMPADGFDRLEVFGNGWAARVQPNPRPFELWDSAARWPISLEIGAEGGVPTGMLAEELRTFCRVIRRVEVLPAGATFEDARQVLRWLDQMERLVHAVA